MKAIDTYYNGNYFRSRLEARWATLFDLGGIRYEYEPDGFTLSNGNKYLPDFYLPDHQSYAEVKPTYQSDFIHKDNAAANHWVITHEDYCKKWLPFSEHRALMFLIGNPGEYAPIQLRPELYQYSEFGVLVAAKDFPILNKSSQIVIDANKKRFENFSNQNR